LENKLRVDRIGFVNKPLMRQLATARLLDPSPAAIKRLEESIGVAWSVDDFPQALRLVRYRQRTATGKDKERFDYQAELLEWAIAHPDIVAR
jgi:hypothetical protein